MNIKYCHIVSISANMQLSIAECRVPGKKGGRPPKQGPVRRHKAWAPPLTPQQRKWLALEHPEQLTPLADPGGSGVTLHQL